MNLASHGKSLSQKLLNLKDFGNNPKILFYQSIVVLVLPVPTTSSCKDLHVLHPTIPSADNPLLL